MDLFSELPESGGQPAGVAPPAEASHEPDGAVRSWPDAVDTASEAGEAGPGARGSTRGRAGGLSAMLLPELQRIAQSEGITGTARMRKGQLIAAIEERRQGGGSQEAKPQGQYGGEVRAVASQDQQAPAHLETSDNSVQRGAPAGAGANRTFEQDAMEPQTSTQPGLGGTAAGGIGAEPVHGSEAGVGAAHPGGDTVAAANGTAVSSGPREETQQAGDGQRSDRRRRSGARRDEAGEPRAASDGQDQGREGGREQQGGREQVTREPRAG